MDQPEHEQTGESVPQPAAETPVPAGTSPRSDNEKAIIGGALVAVVALLALIYLWASSLQSPDTVPPPPLPEPPTTTPADMSSSTPQGSTELPVLEEDLDAQASADLSGLDTDLADIDAEIDDALAGQ